MRRSATIDGVPLRWEEQGTGTPVVLLHGIPTGPTLWRHVVPRLHGVRALAVELVGYADAIPAGRRHDLSAAAQARYVAGLLDTLAVERAVLVGHDLGGGVAQIVASRWPQRCAGLVLVNSVAYDAWPVPSGKALQAAGPLVARSPKAALWPLFAQLFHRGHESPAAAREALAVHLRPYLDHDGPAALARQARSLDPLDTLAISQRLPQLSLPGRVVWGAADRFLRLPLGRRLAADVGVDLDVIQGGRHWIPEDHPDRLARAVAQVVDASRRAGHIA